MPVLSTATERTLPRWQSILTRASLWFGDQRVTVPLWWPRWMMAFWGFWHITSRRPVLVQMAATSFPTDTSRYCRKLVALWRQEKEFFIKAVYQLDILLQGTGDIWTPIDVFAVLNELFSLSLRFEIFKFWAAKKEILDHITDKGSYSLFSWQRYVSITTPKTHL